MKIKCDECGALVDTLSEWQAHRRTHNGKVDYSLEREPGDAIPEPYNTPKLADESKKLLDNGWSIILYANALGSYTAMATKTPLSDVIHNFEKKTGLKTSVITDDFEPSAALYRLTEQVFGNIV